MRAFIYFLLGIGLISIFGLLSSKPANALAAGCSCPAGSPGGGNSMTCFLVGGATVPAMCNAQVNQSNVDLQAALARRLAQAQQRLNADGATISQLQRDVSDFTGILKDGSPLVDNDRIQQSLDDAETDLANARSRADADQSTVETLRQTLQRVARYAPDERGLPDPISPRVRAGGPQNYSPAPSARQNSWFTLYAIGNVVHSSSSGINATAFGGLAVPTTGYSAFGSEGGAGVRFNLGDRIGLPRGQQLYGALSVSHADTSFKFGAFGGRSDATNFSATAGYGYGANFIIGSIVGSVGDAKLFNPAFGVTDRYGTYGTGFLLSGGRFFNIWSIDRKPEQLLSNGWKSLDFQASAQVGNASNRGNAYTDVFGVQQGQSGSDSWRLGPTGKLSALYKFNEFLLKPYASASVDFAPLSKVFSTGAIIPSATSTPILASFDRVVGTFQSGVKITHLGGDGLSLTASEIYRAGSTTHSIGGYLKLDVPL